MGCVTCHLPDTSRARWKSSCIRKGRATGPGAVRACPKLTTAFRVRTPFGEEFGWRAGSRPATANSLSFPPLSSCLSPSGCGCKCASLLPPLFCSAAVPLESKFDFLTRSGHVVGIVMWLASCLIPHSPIDHNEIWLREPDIADRSGRTRVLFHVKLSHLPIQWLLLPAYSIACIMNINYN